MSFIMTLFNVLNQYTIRVYHLSLSQTNLVLYLAQVQSWDQCPSLEETLELHQENIPEFLQHMKVLQPRSFILCYFQNMSYIHSANFPTELLQLHY